MAAGGGLGKALHALLAIAAVAVLGLGLASCSLIRGNYATAKALTEAGFSVGPTDIRAKTGDIWVVRVEKDTEDLSAAAAEAAGIVWRKMSLRIQGLEVRCGNGFGGEGRFTADRAELERRFGPRDPDLDRRTQAEEEQTAGLVVAGLLLAGLLACGGLAVLVVVLVRRSRRRKPPPGSWGPGGPGGPAGPYPPPGSWGPGGPGGPAGPGWPGGDVSQPPPPRYGPRT